MENRFGEYLWLVSEQARPWLTKTFGRRKAGDDVLKISKWLRKEFSPQRSAMMLELVLNRNRAARKFEKYEQMFFTRVALEMATDQWIAAYKASRFKEFQNIADVCCSIGGDLIGLAQSQIAGACTGYDNDGLSVIYANANLQVYGLHSAVAKECSFEDVDVRSHDAIHIDPDRRKQGRSTRGTSFSPNLESIFARLTGDQASGIKVAPATSLQDMKVDQIEREWIGRRRECQQQMIWSGPLAKNPGCRVATRIGVSGSVTTFAVREELIDSQPNELAGKIQDFIYEPHSVLLAAGLADVLANHLGMEKLAPDVCYFTSNSCIKNRLFSRFKVAQSLKANLTDVARAVQDAGFGELEVKKRGVTEAVSEKYKRIRCIGSGRGTLLLCPFQQQVTAILGVRETSS